VCTTCQQIAREEFTDLAVLKPEEGHKDIRIDQVRALQHTLVLAPYQAKYRTALFLDFQRATIGASNALLKTLEEPPSRVVLLLTADTQESLLPTITSRCEVLRLHPMSVEETKTVLIEKKGASENEANLLAHISTGRIGAAIRLLEDPDLMKMRKQALEETISLLTSSRRERFKYVEGVSRRGYRNREDMHTLFGLWLTFWRDVLICNSGADIACVNFDFKRVIDAVSKQVDLATIHSILHSLETGLQQLDMYVNARLLAENLLLRWPRLKGLDV
jgi:DNA polymerase-3 subunit delta'